MKSDSQISAVIRNYKALQTPFWMFRSLQIRLRVRAEFRCSKPGWTVTWTTWYSAWQLCPLQEHWHCWIFNIPSSSNHSKVLWFCDFQKHSKKDVTLYIRKRPSSHNLSQCPLEKALWWLLHLPTWGIHCVYSWWRKRVLRAHKKSSTTALSERPFFFFPWLKESQMMSWLFSRELRQTSLLHKE